MMRAIIVLAVLPLLLGSCSSPDPMLKEGTWSLPPTGLDANNVNLRAMLVNPNDLVAGTGTEVSKGKLAAPPVERLVTGRRTALPVQVGSSIAAAPPQQSPGPGGAGGPGQQ